MENLIYNSPKPTEEKPKDPPGSNPPTTPPVPPTRF